ncbi:response regulator [Candidatus Magnetobacterium casense]|uniref:Response regulator n=1 Tax=Candidatus Magnetobacterium casense TaxID=1455061 RepID=A0ABS6S2E2_9BACT|nr:response regulator [Candidatus Magnetobacterium casensis]MBV6343010.1 response regulator [Candidatus Magnetobacterium casensis]
MGLTPSVLVVDDESLVRFLVCDVLKDSYTVITAENGEEGLAKFVADAGNGTHIGAVVTDVLMPKMNGVAMYRGMREYRNVPVLFMSGYAGEDNEALTQVLGGKQ